MPATECRALCARQPLDDEERCPPAVRGSFSFHTTLAMAACAAVPRNRRDCRNDCPAPGQKSRAATSLLEALATLSAATATTSHFWLHNFARIGGAKSNPYSETGSASGWPRRSPTTLTSERTTRLGIMERIVEGLDLCDRKSRIHARSSKSLPWTLRPRNDVAAGMACEPITSQSRNTRETLAKQLRNNRETITKQSRNNHEHIAAQLSSRPMMCNCSLNIRHRTSRNEGVSTTCVSAC